MLFRPKIQILNLRGDLNVDHIELQLLGNSIRQFYLGIDPIHEKARHRFDDDRPRLLLAHHD